GRWDDRLGDLLAHGAGYRGGRRSSQREADRPLAERQRSRPSCFAAYNASSAERTRSPLAIPSIGSEATPTDTVTGTASSPTTNALSRTVSQTRSARLAAPSASVSG